MQEWDIRISENFEGQFNRDTLRFLWISQKEIRRDTEITHSAFRIYRWLPVQRLKCLGGQPIQNLAAQKGGEFEIAEFLTAWINSEDYIKRYLVRRTLEGKRSLEN